MQRGKVFVSVDAEGLPFSVTPWLMPGWSLFQEMRRVATRLTRVVAGVLAARGYRVAVADSHGYMVNIDPLGLPRGVTLVRGFPRALSMVAGARGSSFAIFLGYHAAAGEASAFSHTYSGSVVHRVTLNGEPASEYLLNAMLLGEWGVPVALVAGAAELRAEVERHTPWAAFTPLTESLGYLATASRSIEELEEELRAATEEAAAKAERGEARPLKPPSRVRLCVEFHRPLYAETASLIPGSEMEAPTRVCYTASTVEEAYRVFEAMVYLAGWSLRVFRDQFR